MKTTTPARRTGARTLPLAIVLAAFALAAAACSSGKVYMVQNPDGTMSELTADEAVQRLAAGSGNATTTSEESGPLLLVRNPDGTVEAVHKAGPDQEVIGVAKEATSNPDGTLTATVDPTETMLPDDLVVVDIATENPFVMTDERGPVYVQFTVAASDDIVVDQRMPLDLAVVVDRSGSMAGQKIVDVKDAARWMVDNLADDDRITIVSYSSDVRVDASAVLGDGGRDVLLRAIDGISHGGGTNLSGGLEAGADKLTPVAGWRGKRVKDVERMKRVVLLSDGQANEGVTELHELQRMADLIRERGVDITTMGVGLDYNEDLMEQVASSGGGNYYFIEDSQALTSIFDREIEALASVVLRDPVLVLTLPDHIGHHEVFGFPSEMVGNELHVQIGSIPAGVRRRVLFSLSTGARSPGVIELADARLEFHDQLRDRATTEQLGRVSVEATKQGRKVSQHWNADVVEKVERIRNADVRRQVFAELEAGNRNAAQRLVEQRKDELLAVNQIIDSDELDAEVGALGELADTVAAVPEQRDEARRHMQAPTFKRSKKRSKAKARAMSLD